MPGINVIQQHVSTLSRYRMLLVGSWDCNGASSPTALTGDLLKLGSVARTASGTFTYTFSKKPGKIVEAIAGLTGDFTPGDQVGVTAISTANSTIVVETKDGLGNTDIPAVEAIRVTLFVWVSINKNMVND